MINPFPLLSPLTNFRFNSVRAFGNAKTKIFVDGTTSTTYCRMPIFRNPLAEKVDYIKCFFENFAWFEERRTYKSFRNQYRFELIKKFLGVNDFSKVPFEDIKLAEKTLFVKKKRRSTGEPRPDSIKRAKDRIFDYTFNNKFDYFFTGTIDPKKLDSKDPKALLQPIQDWLKDRVKRDGFQYILVAEHHKSGAIHFHGLIKCDKLDLVDSGRKSYKGYKKPMTDHTAIKKGLNPVYGQIVYNLKKWKFGFTTCIKTYGDPLNVAYYITKYITKECKKIFGRFFWHSRGLKKPDIRVDYVDYDSVEAVEFKGTYKYKFIRGEENRRIETEKQRKIEFGEIYCDVSQGVMINLETGEVYYDDLTETDDYETILE